MRECIAADAALSRRDAVIQSIPGFGPVNAACLCAAMPELGSLGRRKAALGRPVRECYARAAGSTAPTSLISPGSTRDSRPARPTWRPDGR